MSKDPAFLFYSGDFIVGTYRFTDEQVGKYIRLLTMQHQNGGYISEKDMLFICKSYDEDIYAKFKISEDGMYYNQRLLDEMTKRKSYSESRRSNRKGKDVTEDVKKDNHMSNICKTYDKHMENENEDVNINDNDNELKVLKNKYNEEWFDEFWSVYPKKVAKKQVYNKFRSLVRDELTLNKIISDVKTKSSTDDWIKQNGQFIPNPLTYLNQERWNDEQVIVKKKLSFMDL